MLIFFQFRGNLPVVGGPRDFQISDLKENSLLRPGTRRLCSTQAISSTNTWLNLLMWRTPIILYPRHILILCFKYITLGRLILNYVKTKEYGNLRVLENSNGFKKPVLQLAWCLKCKCLSSVKRSWSNVQTHCCRPALLLYNTFCSKLILWW